MLRLQPISPMPAEGARETHAAFPKGHLAYYFVFSPEMVAWSRLSEQRAVADKSKRASSWLSDWSGSTSARCATGKAEIAITPWLCSR